MKQWDCLVQGKPSPPYILISTHRRKRLQENIVEKGEIAQNEQFHLYPQCFLCNLIIKSFNSHLSVVVCCFFEIGMVSKWCIRERVESDLGIACPVE